MFTRVGGLALAVLTLAACVSPAPAPGASFRLRLHVEETSPGVFSGTIASPDQGRSGAPLEAVSFVDGVLAFTTPTRATFEGRWDEAAQAWAGTYKPPAGSYPLS